MDGNGLALGFGTGFSFFVFLMFAEGRLF